MKNQLETDIIRFFENIENQDSNSQRDTLRNLMNKYIHLSKCDYLMDSHDLREMILNAKGRIATEKGVVYLSTGILTKKINEDEMRHFYLIESVIAHLNKKDCLKRMPKFDKRDK